MRRGMSKVSDPSWCASESASREHTRGARPDAASHAYGAARSRRSPWRTLLGAVTVALTLGALMSLLGASGAAAAVGPAFSCESEIDFLTQSHADGEATKYYESVFKSGEVVYEERNSKSASSSYNALGYDPTNNYLYSTQLNVTPARHGQSRHSLPDRQHGHRNVAGGHRRLPGRKRRTRGRRLRPVRELLDHRRQRLDQSLRDQRHQLAGQSDQNSHAQPSVETDRLDLLRRVHVGPRRNQPLPR